MMIFAIFIEQMDLSNHSVRSWLWHLLNFIFFQLALLQVLGKVVLKVQKFCWGINFEGWQFESMGETLSEF